MEFTPVFVYFAGMTNRVLVVLSAAIFGLLLTQLIFMANHCLEYDPFKGWVRRGWIALAVCAVLMVIIPSEYQIYRMFDQPPPVTQCE